MCGAQRYGVDFFLESLSLFRVIEVVVRGLH